MGGNGIVSKRNLTDKGGVEVKRPVIQASSHHWVTSVQAEAEQWRDAMDLEEGLPKKGRPVTSGIHGPIPAVWSEGAAGWSSHVVDVDRRPGMVVQFAVQRNRHTQVHAGKAVVHPRHGVVNLPANASAVVRTSDWDGSTIVRPTGVNTKPKPKPTTKRRDGKPPKK